MNVETKAVRRDGGIVLKVKCLNCGVWGEIEQDQLRGENSIICTQCGCHFKIDGTTY